MLLVVLGAGASFDSLIADPPPDVSALGPYTRRGNDFRPPLAVQLFENRANFSQVVADLRELAPLMQPMRQAIEQGVQIEKRLAEHQHRARDQADPDFALERQLRAFRFYLQQIMHDCSEQWPSAMHGSTNYGHLLWRICRWQSLTKEPVCYVTFNYDTLLEAAFRENYDIDADERLENYIGFENAKLIKLHGSANWGRVVNPPLKKRKISTRVPPSAEEVKESMLWMIREMPNEMISSEYVLLRQPNEIVSAGGSDGFLRICFPAIAIPVEEKQDFECPDSHVTALRDLLPTVNKLLVIGWRAAEENFLALLRDALPQRPLLDVVCAGPADAREVNSRLDFLHPNIITADPPDPGWGFSNYLRNASRLEDLLSR